MDRRCLVLFALLLNTAGEIFDHETYQKDIYALIVAVRNDVNFLTFSQDTEEEYKSALVDIGKALDQIKLAFKEHMMMSTCDVSLCPETEIFMNNVLNNVTILQEQTEEIKGHNQIRKKQRVAQECVADIKNRNFEKAAMKLYAVNDDVVINGIVDPIYNEQKTNFPLIIEFVDEVPSIELSLRVYKRLKHNLEANSDLDADLGSLLLISMKKNIVDQIGTSPSTDIEAFHMMEEIKDTIRPIIINHCLEFFENTTEDSVGELNEIGERMTYGMKDFKFFGQISDDLANKLDAKNNVGFIKLINGFRKPVPKILLSKAQYELISDNGVRYNDVEKLFKLRADANMVKNDEVEEWKPFVTQVWKSMADPEISVAKQLKKALLKGFFGEYHLKSLSYSFFKTSWEVELGSINYSYKTILKTIIGDIYAKTAPINLLIMFTKCMNFDERISSFSALYEYMEQKGDLEINSRTVSGILKFKDVVNGALNKNLKFRYVNGTTWAFLKPMKENLINLEDQIEQIIKSAIIKGQYTTTEFKRFSENIYRSMSRSYERIIGRVLSRLLLVENIEKLFDYAESHDDPNLKIVDLTFLCDSTNNSRYQFEAAESFKSVIESDQYQLVDTFRKSTMNKYKYKLSPSVRNAVFSKKVFIKNASRGGEYLYLESDKYAKNDTRSVFTWIPGALRNQSEWYFEYTGERGTYLIKNIHFNEYLFAGKETFGNIRMVYSSKHKTKGNEWRMLPTSGGVLIKNVRYNEYLFAGGFKMDNKRRNIHTFVPGSEVSDGKWYIEDFSTDY